MWTLSGIKNHDFWIHTHVFMITYASICEFLLFWASGSSYKMFKILALIPKSMILEITFNATVDSLDMWYKYNFFDARQIRCKICQKMMIQRGSAYGGSLCKSWFTTKSYLYARFLIADFNEYKILNISYELPDAQNSKNSHILYGCVCNHKNMSMYPKNFNVTSGSCGWGGAVD